MSKIGGFPIKGIYFKALIAGLMPIAVNILILLFWIVVKFAKKQTVKNDLITTLVISNFILQPSVIDMMTRILSCQEIDSGKFYITAQLTLECYTAEHYEYVDNT